MKSKVSVINIIITLFLCKVSGTISAMKIIRIHKVLADGWLSKTFYSPSRDTFISTLFLLNYYSSFRGYSFLLKKKTIVYS